MAPVKVGLDLSREEDENKMGGGRDEGVVVEMEVEVKEEEHGGGS